MSNNTYWAEATDSVNFVDDDWTDNFGTPVDEGKFGLGLGDVVIEGTLDDLRDLGQRIIAAADEREAQGGWDGEASECADGCGLAVDHDPPCRVKPGGAVLSNEPMGTIGAPW